MRNTKLSPTQLLLLRGVQGGTDISDAFTLPFMSSPRHGWQLHLQGSYMAQGFALTTDSTKEKWQLKDTNFFPHILKNLSLWKQDVQIHFTQTFHFFEHSSQNDFWKLETWVLLINVKHFLCLIKWADSKGHLTLLCLHVSMKVLLRTESANSFLRLPLLKQ